MLLDWVPLAGSEDQMAELDRRLRGWVIPTEDLAIATRADGSPWLLGSGGFGRVRGCLSFASDSMEHLRGHALATEHMACMALSTQWPLASDSSMHGVHIWSPQLLQPAPHLVLS